MAVGQTTWPEPVKAACIGAAQAGLDVEEISSTYGVPERTVYHWLRIPPKALLSQQVATVKLDLGTKAEEIAHKLVDQAEGKIEDANLTSTMTSFGIAVDKMLLLRGQPTVITSNPDTLRHEIAGILALAMTRKEQGLLPQAETVEAEFTVTPETE